MSIKLKKKYDYTKTQVGQIIPISSIISIEKDNSSGYSNRMFDTYKVYYNKQTLYKKQILIMVYQIIIPILK